MLSTKVAQAVNGTAPREDNQFVEIGTTGLDVWSGYITEASNAKLEWPTCWPIYSPIWRADPETALVRNLLSAMAGKQTATYVLREMAEEPTDDDKRAVEFSNEVLEDIDGGFSKTFRSMVTKTPFFGWIWFENLLGMRQEGWSTSDPDDRWESRYNDGRVGFRRLAYRHYSSFWNWDINDKTGNLRGMTQHDHPNQSVTIPIERSTHVTYGDDDNPEGLATLEPLWRLEYILRGMEMVQGIGFEHTAGYVKFEAEKTLTDADKVNVKAAARALLSGHQGNHLALPAHITADIIDTPFAAAAALEEAIQHRRILKLSLFGAQFASISTMSGAGSYAALSDSSSMFLLMYNSMTAGFANQMDRQLTKQLFNHPINAAAFPNMTRLPRLTVNSIDKVVELGELAEFAEKMSTIMTLTDDDMINIRTKSGILS